MEARADSSFIAHRSSFMLHRSKSRGRSTNVERFSALIGFVVILGIAFGLSNNKRAIRWRTVGWGLLLQILIAIAVLKGELIARAFASVAPPLERWGAALIFVIVTVVVAQAVKLVPLPLHRFVWYAFGLFA